MSGFLLTQKAIDTLSHVAAALASLDVEERDAVMRAIAELFDGDNRPARQFKK